MADKKTRRIPKHIGGVKIPKDVRRQGEALIDTVVAGANSPAGREMIAGALAMAATAATAAMAKGRADRAAAAAPPPPAAPVPPATAYDGAEQPPRDARPALPPEVSQVIDTVAGGVERWATDFARSLGRPRS